MIPAIEGRIEAKPFAGQAALWGTIIPAAWSFMLAARARGLGTVWTTFHLSYEREAAEILGIPYDEVSQAAMIPLAYTIGDRFQAGAARSAGIDGALGRLVTRPLLALAANPIAAVR